MFCIVIDQVNDGIMKIKDNMAPYTHFVNAQLKDVGILATELVQTEKKLNEINSLIEKEFSQQKSQIDRMLDRMIGQID